MKRHLYILGLALLCCCLAGCTKKPDKPDWSISLDPADKRPYGSFLAFESLPHFFPDARIDILPSMFRYTSMDKRMYAGKGPALLVLSGLGFRLSDEELQELIRFAGAGNEVMIFCSQLDERLSKKLSCKLQQNGMEEWPPSVHNPAVLNTSLLRLSHDPERSYGYEGRSIKGFFRIQANTDTASKNNAGKRIGRHQVLGFTPSGANFVRFPLGSGHISLHAAPLVLSNYFLLQPGNEHYLAGIWQSLPEGISHIYWNAYYKRSSSEAGMAVLFRYPAIRWGLLILMGVLLLYVLFESKRRQRIVPVMAPLSNTSVSFVETVGRLYFNKGDHTNLAHKMTQHFLEWVRTHYYLNTRQLDDAFTQQLIHKSGLPPAQLHRLVDMIRQLRQGAAVDEDFLYKLHCGIEAVYQNQVLEPEPGK